VIYDGRADDSATGLQSGLTYCIFETQLDPPDVERTCEGLIMGLMDAQEYDPRPAQRRWRMIGIAVIAILVAGTVWWFFRYYPEEQVINKFFQALERKDYDTAYALYNADPNWKQHPGKYDQYTEPQFMLDWGPSGDYGVITSHHIDCAIEPPKKAFRSPSGVIIVVTINNVTAKPLSMWVEKKSKTITLSPQEAVCSAPK
jgi:hypothetical protein